MSTPKKEIALPQSYMPAFRLTMSPRKRAYMEAVLAIMRDDVVWANGLEGGHVYGHAGVRDYWTRQWAMIDSRAEPDDPADVAADIKQSANIQ